TGHSIKGEFLKYWQSHGGVALLGYPVSEELNEISPADGKVHIMQYFERARLEWHQEAAGTPAQVQLGLVGQEWLALAHP
ncbi:MAG: vanomycin resistance protein VanB, partial [Chloroflexota bacterium]